MKCGAIIDENDGNTTHGVKIGDKETVTKNDVEPMVIGAAAAATNVRQQETYHKMIERVKEYHNKLDLSQHTGKGKVNLFVCNICFGIFSEQESLRNHFIKVC